MSTVQHHRVRGGQSPCSPVGVSVLRSFCKPASRLHPPLVLFRWRRRDWGRSRHRQTKRQGQHWQIKTQKTCCGYSAHHTATRDRMGTTWLPRFGPSCRRPINLELNPPDLGLPLGGRGSQGASKDVDVGNMREIRHCGHFAALPNVPLPANQLLSSRPLSRLRWNAPPHPTWGGLRMNTNALLKFKLATPRLRVCAPFPGHPRPKGVESR